MKYSVFLPKISKDIRFSLEIFLHVSKIAVFHMILQCEVYVKLILKKSRAIQKNPLHQKFRHNINCISPYLHINLRILYEGVVFPQKSWTHIIRQNSVLFTCSFMLGLFRNQKLTKISPENQKTRLPQKELVTRYKKYEDIKNPLHQKFRRSISFIFLNLYIYLCILYREGVFRLKSWIHIIQQNSVLFYFLIYTRFCFEIRYLPKTLKKN